MSDRVTYPTHRLNPEDDSNDYQTGKYNPTFEDDNGHKHFNEIGHTNTKDFENEGADIHTTQAMTEEVYQDHVQMADDKNKSKSKAKGCWASIVNFIRSFWATRWTIDANEKETLIKTTIRELVIYLIFFWSYV